MSCSEPAPKICEYIKTRTKLDTWKRELMYAYYTSAMVMISNSNKTVKTTFNKLSTLNPFSFSGQS